MKNLILTTLLMVGLWGGDISAQQSGSSEHFGNTLNLGLGLGYYGYVGHFMPVISVNYEFQVVNNLTLAPFVTLYSYRNYRHWENQNYYYRQSVIPLGVKGTYYFDKLLGLHSRWDLYAAGSLGFAIKTTRWQNGFNGDIELQHSQNGLYLDAHIGTEFHLNQKVGLFLDLSTGLSTFGAAFHL